MAAAASAAAAQALVVVVVVSAAARARFHSEAATVAASAEWVAGAAVAATGRIFPSFSTSSGELRQKFPFLHPGVDFRSLRSKINLHSGSSLHWEREGFHRSFWRAGS